MTVGASLPAAPALSGGTRGAGAVPPPSPRRGCPRWVGWGGLLSAGSGRGRVGLAFPRGGRRGVAVPRGCSARLERVTRWVGEGHAPPHPRLAWSCGPRGEGLAADVHQINRASVMGETFWAELILSRLKCLDWVGGIGAVPGLLRAMQYASLGLTVLLLVFVFVKLRAQG